MKCPEPEWLLGEISSDRGGEPGEAMAHLEQCARCRSAVDALLAPADPLRQVASQVPPARSEPCPSAEDLACWAMGDRLPGSSAEFIARHVGSCEACFSACAAVKLEFGPPAPLPRESVQLTSAGVERPMLLAQIWGAAVLVVLASLVAVSWIRHFSWSSDGPQSAPAPAISGRNSDLPLELRFVYRPKGTQDLHQAPFRMSPPIQLSGNYEFAVEATALRAGWLGLAAFESTPGQSWQLSKNAFDGRFPRVDPGASVRFPLAPTWQSVPAVAGSRKIFAVFSDNSADAAKLAAHLQSPSSEVEMEALEQELEGMAVHGNCTSGVHVCTWEFRYEVF